MTPERWQRLDRLFQSAVDLPPDHRGSYLDHACAGDPELRREVESLIESHDGAGSFIEDAALPTGELRAGPTAERLGPYRILRELGHGGMGRVYLAEQEGEGFRRRVALKLLERRGGDAAVERRFGDERRILAGLEHPGIARFYDAGCSSDGRWFLALEYVEGVDLRAYVESRGLDLRSRVELFLQVLDAVDFAHRRLVVHRDLKPGNVLVDTQGRAKLLDFGISKILDPGHDADATRTERPAFTLAYASPEQLRHERVSVATDVYSAGVMLYELLAGRLPLDRRQLAEPEPDPQPPSTVADAPIRRRDLAGDLDAIILKALRPSADSRYSSAASFAADLRRWLAGQPVEAHRGGRRYRLAKFAARHRLSLTAAVAVLVALAGGLSVALVQRSRALAAQARAEQTLAEMHALSESMLFEIHEGVRLLPNSLKVTGLIARRATEVLDRLASTAGDDPRLLGDLATGYERLGELFAGTPALGRTLGQPKAAIGHFERALALREDLAARPGTRFAERLAAARTLILLGGAQAIAGDTAAAAKSIDESVQRLSGMEAEAPDPAAVRMWLGVAHNQAWRIAMRSPGLAPTVPVQIAAAAGAWRAFLQAPSPAALGDRGFVRDAHTASYVLRKEGHLNEALRMVELGLEAIERGVLGGPESFTAAERRTMLLAEKVHVLRALQRPADSLAACQEMLRAEAAIPTDADDALSRTIARIEHHQQAAVAGTLAGDFEFAGRTLAESERALAAAESRHGAAAFAVLRLQQEETRGDVLVGRAARAASARERARLSAAALDAYQRALPLADSLSGGSVHRQTSEDAARRLRDKMRASFRNAPRSSPRSESSHRVTPE